MVLLRGVGVGKSLSDVLVVFEVPELEEAKVEE